MAKPKSKASSSVRSNRQAAVATVSWDNEVSEAYSTKKVYTAEQRDKAVSEARESASNVQTQLERDAVRLNNLKREIAELEEQLHQSKMRHRDMLEDYANSIISLNRHLDSLI